MTRFLLFFGIVFIIMGLLFWKKNVLWLHQGAYIRPKKEGYRRFAGLVDIGVGVCMILISCAGLFLEFEMPSWVMYIVLAVYLILIFYGEKRYKDDNKDDNNESK